MARIQARQDFLFYDIDTQKNIRETWNRLASNERFWSADAKILSIFSPPRSSLLKDEQTPKQYFEQEFGITIDDTNQGIYEEIFRNFRQKKSPI